MHLVNKRQGSEASSATPRLYPSEGQAAALFTTTTITSTYFGQSTETNTNGQTVAIQSSITAISTLTTRVEVFTFDSSSPTTSASAIISSSPTPTQSTSPSQTSATASTGIPLSTLVPAIVVPIVIVALAAPVALYFFLTRHDRQRRKRPQMSSRISSRNQAQLSTAIKSPTSRQSSSETGNSKASEIMNFDLGTGVEKPLPAISIIQASESTYERPDTLHVNRGFESPIGQAISRYSGSHDRTRLAVDPPLNRSSIQELSEENMRIARLANDSKVSFRGREPDDVSDVSCPDERRSRRVPRRGMDELSDVSSMYEDVTAASSDRGGGILGNQDARRSGPFG